MLIADRFLPMAGALVDLASGDRVELRRLRPVGRDEQLTWLDECAARANAASAHTARLIDFGVLDADTRFEAYGPAVASAQMGDSRAWRVQVKQVEDVLLTARLGEPHHLRLWTGATPPSVGLLDVLSRAARIRGFVPLSVELLLSAVDGLALPADDEQRQDWRDALAHLLTSRHLMLIARQPVVCHRHANARCSLASRTVCPTSLARATLAIASVNCRPTVLLTDRSDLAGVRPCCRPAARRPAASLSHSQPRCRASTEGEVARAAEAHEAYLAAHPEVIDLRTRSQVTFERWREGPSRAEAGLREVAAALARRDDWHGAASAMLRLGCLLLDRGRALDAARVFDEARRRFDQVRDTCGVIRACVYLGLAWTDEARFAEAGAALRTARVAAQQVGSTTLEQEARLALARCLYWQGRFDEAHVLTASLADAEGHRVEEMGETRGRAAVVYHDAGATAVPAVAREAPADAQWGSRPRLEPHFDSSSVDPDHHVRLLAISARLALAEGDVRAALGMATAAVARAVETARPLDACIAHTALAGVYGGLRDVENLVEQVRRGLLAARHAHAPLRAFRLRLLAVDVLRQAGRTNDIRRPLQRLSSLNTARFPALLRTRLEIVVRNGDDGSAARWPRTTDEAHRMAVSACPWRPMPRTADLVDDVVGILHTCHDLEDEEAGLHRVCEVVRERTSALVVALFARGGREAIAPLARVGCGVGEARLAERVVDTGLAVAPIESSFGVEAASPIRYASSIVGAVFARWPSDAMLDARRVIGLLSAAAAAAAPHVRSVLDRRHAPALPPLSEVVQLVGVSAALDALRRSVQRAAAAPFPVLIEGESGSGKELVARAIHRESARRSRRFSAINCAALTDDLLEAELFGHARGAFTGAVTDRVGLFEEADGGTLFLDEVSDLSARAQAKLLRVLQEGEVRRVGENVARSVDVRVVAATNRQLQLEVEAGRFRRDLFYRLHVVHIAVPPLRDRPEDIALLAQHFWQAATARTGSKATLAPATLAALSRYDWPGNVRELQNVMAALSVSSPHRGSVGPSCLPPAIARSEVSGSTLDAARSSFERSFVRAALARAGGHRGRAAAALGVTRQGLAKLIARLGIDPQVPQK